MTANEYIKSIKDNLDSVDSNLKKISDDCISRSDAIAEIFEEFMTEEGVQDNTAYKCIDIIKNMPSVNPQKNIVNNGTMNITL